MEDYNVSMNKGIITVFVIVTMLLIIPVMYIFNDSPDLSYRNSIYYPDCMTIQKEGFIPNVEQCIEYVEINPNATGQDIVYNLTATPAEKLLDKRFGQISGLTYLSTHLCLFHHIDSISFSLKAY